MITRITKMIGLGFVPLVVAATLTFSASSAPALAQPQAPPSHQAALAAAPAAQTATIDLCAGATTATMPDGQVINIWGFGEPLGTGGCVVQLPGPELQVAPGAAVTVNLTNYLPVPTSIIFPGQSAVGHNDPTPGLLTGEADANGGTVQYTFTAGPAGTYLYESGTTDQPQTAMGLYGALIVGNNSPGEQILVLSEIDPNLNSAVSAGGGFDLLNYNPTYWLMNGRAYPDTFLLGDNDLTRPNQPYSSRIDLDLAQQPNVLVRYVNAGG
ncbi:MAG: multicopper oxidase domain-containing protein, partial [Chloroflexota bacterium]